MIDTYGCLYDNTFNASFPYENLFASDNDSGGDSQFMFNIFLEAVRKYILVITTYYPKTTGEFSIIATGSDVLDLIPESES